MCYGGGVKINIASTQQLMDVEEIYGEEDSYLLTSETHRFLVSNENSKNNEVEED